MSTGTSSVVDFHVLAIAMPRWPWLPDLDDSTTQDVERENAVSLHNQKVLELYDGLPWDHPVGRVLWVHISKVQANDWNPNAVARVEMKLLHTSIEQDGFTQPVVAVFDPALSRFVIIDGFHRYTTMLKYQDIYDSTGGYLPIVIIDKPIEDRIASTVRHNRARGKHSVAGMSNLVFQMLMAGATDREIIEKIGLEAEELARLKHVTGYSKLYANRKYTTATMLRTQAEERAAWARAHPEEVMVEGV